VLTRKEFARRWRDCNPQEAPYTSDSDEEESWRTSILELLSKAHTLGNFADISFEAVESNYSVSGPLSSTVGIRSFLFVWSQDFAFELDCETFKAPPRASYKHQPPCFLLS